MEDNKTSVEEGARSFAVFLQQFDGGTLHAEMSEELRDLNKYRYDQAVHAGGHAKGKISLSFEIAFDSSGVASIKPEITIKKPKVVRSRQIYWTTPGSNLTPENPRQQKLPLIAVSNPNQPARDVSSDTREVRSV